MQATAARAQLTARPATRVSAGLLGRLFAVDACNRHRQQGSAARQLAPHPAAPCARAASSSPAPAEIARGSTAGHVMAAKRWPGLSSGAPHARLLPRRASSLAPLLPSPPPVQVARPARRSVVVRAGFLGSTTNQIMVLSTFLPLVAGRFGLAPTSTRHTTPGLKLLPEDKSTGLYSADPAGEGCCCSWGMHKPAPWSGGCRVEQPTRGGGKGATG